jgi:UDP-N-acetylglucosamine 2-epimerase
VDRILSNSLELMNDATVREQWTRVVNPFGDGRAAQKIVDSL